MYDIVGKRRWYFLFSALITIPGLIFIVLGGLRPSVDFTGGTVWQVRYESQPAAGGVQAALIDLGYTDATVRELAGGFLEIRTEPIGLLPPQTPLPTVSIAPSASPDASAASAAPTASPTPVPTATPTPAASGSPAVAPSPSGAPIAEGTQFDDLQKELVARFGPGEPRSVTTVGPLIGSELIRSSIILIVVGELFILLYLWVRFGFRFGTAAIVALLHDVIVVVGIFAILGYFIGLEFDALFVTALLTVIGFSVHDTIVVFDRIRENRIRHASEPFGAIVNHSILQTLGRSINTSVTVVVTLAALFLLGPATIRTFTLALLIGVISGTYSSIFNASQLLVAWYEWDANRKNRQPARVKPLSR
ncbi:MAG TPA: protein translocase subunit SecF [Candidatus Limnocylindrales bacterium]|nr:protein translocase subunit SecF [Candidatus Limnocylindrales bacterium]